jgi:hypothetical protein
MKIDDVVVNEVEKRLNVKLIHAKLMASDVENERKINANYEFCAGNVCINHSVICQKWEAAAHTNIHAHTHTRNIGISNK